MIKMHKKSCVIFAILLTVSIFYTDIIHSSKNSNFYKINLNNSNNLNNPSNCPNISIYLDWNETIINTGEDAGRDLVIDDEGNIYITGKEYNTSRGVFDIVIAKYNSSGTLQWKSDWQNNSDSIGYGITLDPSQNIYITGYVKNTTEDIDIVLLKYNNDGKHQWNRTWGGGQWDIGYGIAINNSDEVFITGSTESYGTLGDVVLLKYNCTGHFKWYKTIGGFDSDVGYNLDIDSIGNIYITGYTSSFGAASSNGYLIKYNRLDEFEWNITWGGALPDNFYDLAIDNTNGIYICGNSKSYSQGFSDITLLKYNASGHLEFNETWQGSEQDYGYSIVLDSKNNSYIAGYTESYGGSDRDASLIKFNSTGDYQWYKLWTQGLEDEGYGIAIDQFDNKIITGKSEKLGGDYDIFIAKFSPKPDYFILTSNAGNPDPDGNFNISWQIALDANNYSLFQYDKLITEYNESLIKIVEGNINRTYEFKNLGEDIYYFMAIAFNEYGNTTSNCLKIIVQYPPEEFYLAANDEDPDTDGKINLTWTISNGAYNYSIYNHTGYIYKIDNNGTLVVDGLTNNSYLIESLANGEYYYAVVAINPAGQTTSNCTEIIVRRKANAFILYSNADNPDSDGVFDLIWTRSVYCKNYTIYFSTSYIDKINHTVLSLYNYTPEFDWPTYRYPITGKGNGDFYYRVVAFNEYGNFTSECIKITVLIPKKSSSKSRDKEDSQFEIDPIVIQLIMLAIFISLIGILIITRKKLKVLGKR
jgi:uncharacterized delta-60 repeat protein